MSLPIILQMSQGLRLTPPLLRPYSMRAWSSPEGKRRRNTDNSTDNSTDKIYFP